MGDSSPHRDGYQVAWRRAAARPHRLFFFREASRSTCPCFARRFASSPLALLFCFLLLYFARCLFALFSSQFGCSCEHVLAPTADTARRGNGRHVTNTIDAIDAIDAIAAIGGGRLASKPRSAFFAFVPLLAQAKTLADSRTT